MLDCNTLIYLYARITERVFLFSNKDESAPSWYRLLLR
jgi:hypothetical protein